MSILQAHKLKISLLIVLLLSAGLSFYSLWSCRESASSAGADTPRQAFRPPEGAAQPGGNRAPGGEGAPQQDRRPQAPPDGQAHSSEGRNFNGRPGGGMPPAGGIRLGGDASSSRYAAPVVGYTVVFFAAMAAAYYGIVRKEAPLQLRSKSPLTVWMLLGTGLLLRIAAAPWIPGHPSDMQFFKSWAASAANNLTGFYLHSSSDYPPFYIYILYAVGKLAQVAALKPYFTVLVKLPSILADVATACLLYKVARKHVSYELSLLIAVFYTFNPAIWLNSTFWGQVDSFFTLLVVAAIVFLSQGRPGWSAALLAAAVLMKPQGLIYAPVLFFELLKTRRWRPWLIAAASGLLTALFIVAPFSAGQHPLWLFKLYAGTVNEYPYASVNAFNFFALLGANYKPNASTLLLFSYRTWGMSFIVIVTLFSWWASCKSRSAKFASAAALLQIAGVFTFSVSMHERYLFPAAALAVLAYCHLSDKRLLWLAAGFSLTIFTNTYFVLYNATNGATPYSAASFATSLANVLLYVFLAKVVFDHVRQQNRLFVKKWINTQHNA